MQLHLIGFGLFPIGMSDRRLSKRPEILYLLRRGLRSSGRAWAGAISLYYLQENPDCLLTAEPCTLLRIPNFW